MHKSGSVVRAFDVARIVAVIEPADTRMSADAGQNQSKQREAYIPQFYPAGPEDGSGKFARGRM